MPRFVNLPTTDGNEESVRVDRIESVSHGWTVPERCADPLVNESWSIVRTNGCVIINVALPKSRVMELLGLHLTGNGEEWV